MEEQLRSGETQSRMSPGSWHKSEVWSRQDNWREDSAPRPELREWPIFSNEVPGQNELLDMILPGLEELCILLSLCQILSS